MVKRIVAGNAAAVAFYLLSRTEGIPWGAHAYVAEEPSAPDVAATAFELALIGVLLALLPARAPLDGQRASPDRSAVLVPPLHERVLTPAARLAGGRLLWALAGVVAVLGLLRVTALEPLRVPSGSMAPTIAAGDHVLADKVTYRLRPPRRDELVVFHAPDSGELLLKRVVAVAGDRVELRDGVLYVNGRPRAERYVAYERVESVYFGPVQVPAGSVFVMGDARANSVDSRAFGPVPEDALVGRAVRADVAARPAGRPPVEPAPTPAAS